MTKCKSNQNPWNRFHGPNLGYIVEQYEQYMNNTASVDEQLQELFVKWGSPLPIVEKAVSKESGDSAVSFTDEVTIKQILQAAKLLEDIRSHGHLAASINPLGETNKEEILFNLDKYELTEEVLRAIPAQAVWKNAPADVQSAADAFQCLKELYTSTLAYEFAHVHTKEEQDWLTQMIETGSLRRSLSKDEQIGILKRLTSVEGFEQFLHKTFVGQKRFSIEGVDTLVPILDEVIRNGNADSVKNVIIGMAHRGRLSVLAHVLEKPYNNIFAEFLHASTRSYPLADNIKVVTTEGWTGDVKYHLGRNRVVEDTEAHVTRVTLANNPSHLEFVDPVVEGYTRAAQEDRHQAGYPKQDIHEAFAILVHGDAAFPGQGIVAETLNLGGLTGYQTGGTIHIIANNLVGFTTDSHDSRSTRYASDLAKGFEIPIVHVNADDPEACLAAAYLAYQYRSRFHKDFLIDLVGYRRFGHNEMDDPMVTQPKVYKIIAKHPTVRALYANELQVNGVLSEKEVQSISDNVQSVLQAEYEMVSGFGKDTSDNEIKVPDIIVQGIPSMMKTGLPIEILQELNRDLLQWPEGFRVYPKLKRILERREHACRDNGKVEWAHAEALAFASILQAGTPIRLTGQDSERGTFAQRHIVLHDTETNETFSPLHRLPQAQASFAIHNSPLSEAAVVGFEYGYNVFAPETLVMWEAQYGDFANTAQALFDQFVSAGRAKWGQKSGLVLLLPHGYEGQGPEHSSARLERFLQLAAENNWTVANLTSAAQYFHILRRQALSLKTEYVRPLVIMTPKSLLRNPLTASAHEELSDRCFQTVLEQPKLEGAEKVRRLILTTGKMAIDLATEMETGKEHLNETEFHIVRVEQLYPFPEEKIKLIINRYTNLEEIVWVQEEPKNMGAWHFMAPILYKLANGRMTVGYIGRPDRSSPSGGDPAIHKQEQERIIYCALKSKKLSYSQEIDKFEVKH